jgi:hypothetical protein
MIVKYTLQIFFFVVIVTILSCSKQRDKDFEFLRPNEELISDKLASDEIKMTNYSGENIHTYKNEKGTEIHFFFSKDKLLFERWRFDMTDFSFDSVDSVISKNSEYSFGYINGFDERKILEGEKMDFLIRNLETNKIFVGSVYNEGERYTLCVDFYYPFPSIQLQE